MMLLNAILVCYVMFGPVSTETSVQLFNQELVEPRLSVQKRQVPPFGFHVGPAPIGLHGQIGGVICNANPCSTYCDRAWAHFYPLVNGTCTYNVGAEMTGLIFSSLKASASCCCHNGDLLPGPGNMNPLPPLECQRRPGYAGKSLAECRRVQCKAFCRHYLFDQGDCGATDSSLGHERFRGRFEYHSADCDCWLSANVSKIYADFTLAIVNHRVDLYGAEFGRMPVPRGGSAAGGGVGPYPGAGWIQMLQCVKQPTPSQIPAAFGEICLPPPPDVKMFLCAQPLSVISGRKRQLELPAPRQRKREKKAAEAKPTFLKATLQKRQLIIRLS